MRPHAEFLRHCRDPFVGPPAGPQALLPEEGVQATAPAQPTPPALPYGMLRRALRQRWRGWVRRPAVVFDQAAAAWAADQAMATIQLHLACILDLIADATYADLPDPQRRRIQAEINQLVAAVDHIARTTTVAGVHLLDGSGGWPGPMPAVPDAPLQPSGAAGGRQADAFPLDLRAQTLALHCISAATVASARAGQSQLEQARAQVARTRACWAMAQLLARLTQAQEKGEKAETAGNAAAGLPSSQARGPGRAATARGGVWPLWSRLRQALQRWLARDQG